MFSNGPQLMGKRFMANLQSSLDSTYKIIWQVGGFTDIACINIIFLYQFYCQEICWNTPKLISVHTHQSWKQKWHVTVVIPRMHCNVTPDVSFCWEGRYIPQLAILDLKMHFKNFQPGGTIPQLFIPCLKLKDLHWYLLWGFLQY